MDYTQHVHEANPQCRRTIQTFLGHDLGSNVSSYREIYREMWSGGQYARVCQNGLDRNSFFKTLKQARGMAMIDSLREIHIKIRPARIVVYSQRRVC
jgi:hypothetical protein